MVGDTSDVTHFRNDFSSGLRDYITSAYIPYIKTFDMSMTSRQIAELAGKRHAHVVRDAKKKTIAPFLTIVGVGSTFLSFSWIKAKNECSLVSDFPNNLQNFPGNNWLRLYTSARH
nr:hypothetical protein [Desulfopila sp. IMCC35006]